MGEFLASPVASVVFLVALTAALVAAGIYVIGRVRADLMSREPPSSQWITNFRHLHSQGELSDEEYRTIKSVLAERLEDELNSADEPR
ncbi:MAG: hypothetical protein AB7O59_14655 [Pirellulales bacterium]